MGHNIHFKGVICKIILTGVICKIIPKSSFLPLLIWSSDWGLTCFEKSREKLWSHSLKYLSFHIFTTTAVFGYLSNLKSTKNYMYISETKTTKALRSHFAAPTYPVLQLIFRHTDFLHLYKPKHIEKKIKVCVNTDSYM